MSNRDILREVVTQGTFSRKTLLNNSHKYEIRQPTIAGRNRLREKSMVNGEVDSLKLFVFAIIENCYVPDTDIKIFEDSDFESLSNCPTGSFVDELGNTALALMDVNVNLKKND